MGLNEEPWDLVVGQVVAPFGTEGELRVRLETDFPERFEFLEEVCLEMPDGEERRERVAGVRTSQKGVLLSLEGYGDRGRAGELRGAWVKIRKSMAMPLPPGSYWVHDIVGLEVVTVEGEKLGPITEVVHGPALDVYVTPSRMIPAVKEMVREIDMEGGRVVVSLPPEDDNAGAREDGSED